MDAVLVRECGRLEIEAVRDPEPVLGEVVVELRAAALNRRDLGVVAGRGCDLPRPFAPGSDGAGTRRDTGEEVVILPWRRLSWHEAAALPLAGLTAYCALFSRGGLRAAETALVLGAGGGVATFAVQLAAQAGARVLVTSSSDEKIQRARELGAEGGSILGTTVGSPRDFAGLLDAVVGGDWRPVLDTVRPLADVAAAPARMAAGEQFGKLVLETA